MPPEPEGDFFGPSKQNADTDMPDHHICLHGHFYQPPRENPWLEALEIQDSAYPYHDWNARITSECYARNASARILDDQNRIARITNNYARMSFNVGPTLMAWLEQHHPETYAAILAADQLSRQHFAGFGSAIAQPYNHMIMPLANRADRITQIVWGIADFERRFGRAPEGMWLPEAAVDLQTLAVMADRKIAFTILSPPQADRIRPVGTPDWHDVSDGSIDPRRAYLQRLEGGRRMAIFFYDGPIAREVAFEGLLNSGEALVERLLAAFDHANDDHQIVHIATDGETFGHHHRFGDMALAWALEKIDSGDAARLTNYAQWLAEHPPTWEVRIKENTAWSCSHGVERWKSDCGCHSGQQPQWHQQWRAPLRRALDGLRDTLADIYTVQAGTLFAHPWQVRDDYIQVILERSADTIDRFLKAHLNTALTDQTRTQALKLLEMQRHAMLMYTSCGWFFDDLSGIETVQVIMYAGRALQLAEELGETGLEAPFLEALSLARSNFATHGDGGDIYRKWVKPAGVDLKKAATHYAISSFFEDFPAAVTIYCYEFENLESRNAEAGIAKLAVGRVQVVSQITRQSAHFHYAVLHMGDHNISCGIRPFDPAAYAGMTTDVMNAFDNSDMPLLFQRFNTHFPGALYSLTSLFRDEQRKVLATILEATTADALGMYRRLYDNHAFLMRFIHDSGSPIPQALVTAAQIVINSDLNGEFGRRKLDFEAIRSLIDEARRTGIALDADTLEFTLRHTLEHLARAFKAHPDRTALLEPLTTGAALAAELPFTVGLQEIQNVHYRLKQTVYPLFQTKAAAGDAAARNWVETFGRLATILKIRMH
jgi:alpha-amylase/alpha-mannosidase (GH57 family)